MNEMVGRKLNRRIILQYQVTVPTSTHKMLHQITIIPQNMWLCTRATLAASLKTKSCHDANFLSLLAPILAMCNENISPGIRFHYDSSKRVLIRHILEKELHRSECCYVLWSFEIHIFISFSSIFCYAALLAIEGAILKWKYDIYHTVIVISVFAIPCHIALYFIEIRLFSPSEWVCSLNSSGVQDRGRQ